MLQAIQIQRPSLTFSPRCQDELSLSRSVYLLALIFNVDTKKKNKKISNGKGEDSHRRKKSDKLSFSNGRALGSVSRSSHHFRLPFLFLLFSTFLKTHARDRESPLHVRIALFPSPMIFIRFNSIPHFFLFRSPNPFNKFPS